MIGPGLSIVVLSDGRPPVQLFGAGSSPSLDAQYFDDDPGRPVQLRPRLASDLSPLGRGVKQGEMILAARNLHPRLHCIVRPPRRLRENTPEAVEWAIKTLERDMPFYGRAFRQAAQGQTPAGFKAAAPKGNGAAG